MAIFSPRTQSRTNFSSYNSLNVQSATFNSIFRNPPLNLNFYHTKTRLKFRLNSGTKHGANKRVSSIVVRLQVDELDKQVPVAAEDGVNCEEGEKERGFDLKWPPWKSIPKRYKLIGTTSFAFVICNMDKVNLSVAIIPMSHEFGWSSSVSGLVQSSFFWGYALSQLPGGWLAKIFGGRRVLAFGVLAWSVATAFVPTLAGYLPGLLLSRVLVGIGEGVSPSAATDLIARSIPVEERSRAVSFVFGGLSVGSVAGLVLAPPLIQNFGWESVFYLFGLFGIAWFLGFQYLEGGQSAVAAPITSGLESTSSYESWFSSREELRTSLKRRVFWSIIDQERLPSWHSRRSSFSV